MLNILPTVGRVVYYKSRGSKDNLFPSTDRAAIITDVREIVTSMEEANTQGRIEVRLAVLNPEGLFFSSWLTQGEQPGQWDWMPYQKDQQMRLSQADYQTNADGSEAPKAPTNE